MENKSQVSFEYLVLVAILILIASLIVIISGQYINTSETVRETGETYSERATEMMEALR